MGNFKKRVNYMKNMENKPTTTNQKMYILSGGENIYKHLHRPIQITKEIFRICLNMQARKYILTTFSILKTKTGI